MKASSLALLLTIFWAALNMQDVYARNDRKTTVIKTDTQLVLLKAIDQPLNRKEKIIRKKLATLDLTVQGFSEGKKYKPLSPATLKQFIKKEDELKDEYISKIEGLLGKLNSTLNELKMKFLQKTDHKAPHEFNKEAKILQNSARNEINIFNRKISAVNLTFDQRRDTIIEEIKDIEQKKINQRRRRRRR